MTRIANRDAGRAVDRKETFKGSNLFGYWAYNAGRADNDLYIVNSYGNHFPMAVFDQQAEKWFHNTDRYSATTSKHQSQAGTRGRGDPMTTAQLLQLIGDGGVAEMVSRRLNGQDRYA